MATDTLPPEPMTNEPSKTLPAETPTRPEANPGSPDEAGSERGTNQKSGWPIGKIAGGLAVLLGVFVAIRQLPIADWVERLETTVRDLGVWGPIVFAVTYILAAVALVPASALTIAAGALFGLWWGFVIVSLSSTASAAVALLIARYLARERVEKIAASNPKFRAIDRAVATGGWKVVAMLRLSPAIPFNLQNYFYGLTSISFWRCILTSWIAMMPGTFLYVYFGYAGKEAASGDGGTAQWVLLGVGLVATIAVTVYLTKLAKKELAAQDGFDGELGFDDARRHDAGVFAD